MFLYYKLAELHELLSGQCRDRSIEQGIGIAGVVDHPIVPAGRTSRDIHSIPPLADRIPERCRDHQLRAAGFLSWCALLESGGPQPGESPCRGSEDHQAGPGSR